MPEDVYWKLSALKSELHSPTWEEFEKKLRGMKKKLEDDYNKGRVPLLDD